jgi:cytochrome c oxidase assembly factor CtaG
VRPDPYAWSLDPDGIIITASLVVAYAVGVRIYPAPRWRIVCFGLGAALVLATHVTPLASVSNHYLLSAHLLQNISLAEWAPALCVLGVPPALAGRLASLPGARFFTHPAVALALWLGAYFAWHVPWAYDTALAHQASLLHLEHACYFTTGCLLWWPVFQEEPQRLSTGAKAVYLFGAFVLISPLGLLLALLPTAIYDFYVDAPRLWGLSPLTDQQIAGVTMTAEEAVVFFAACFVYFSGFLREEESREPVISGSR